MAELVRNVATRCGSREATVGFSLGRKSQVKVEGHCSESRSDGRLEFRTALPSLRDSRRFIRRDNWDLRPRLLPATAPQFKKPGECEIALFFRRWPSWRAMLHRGCGSREATVGVSLGRKSRVDRCQNVIRSREATAGGSSVFRPAVASRLKIVRCVGDLGLASQAFACHCSAVRDE